VTTFSRRLEALVFCHRASMTPQQEGRFQIEVPPHAAMFRLFALDRIVKNNRGTREQTASELRRLRKLTFSRLPKLDRALRLSLPLVPRTGRTNSLEDKIDAVLCAYIGACRWLRDPTE
jgi:predicted RNase H-like nuclease